LRKVCVKKADRREVACEDGVTRRWFAGHGPRYRMRRWAADGVVPKAYEVPASVGLGAEVARRYYGDADPVGILLSETERELMRETA